jgi:hypothetical protein
MRNDGEWPAGRRPEERTNEELDAEVLALDAQQGQRVVRAVYNFLGRFVSYPSDHARVAHALWVLHTHMMQVWDSTPRLAFLSAEPASGKTRALEITELLVPNPVATVNVSPAYLFRKIGSEDGATILYDEIDTVFGPRAKDNEDIRGLLNAGHRRGATTGRCVVRGNDVTLEELPAYAAVALAGLGWLPDTILSRSVIIRMRRRHAGEQVEAFRRRLREAEGWEIRDQLAVWAASAAPNIIWPDLPEQIVDRNADVWEPLIAVADAIGGDWPHLARAAAVALVAEARDVEPSLGIKLLSDIKAVFGEAREMSSKSLLRSLIELEESPWADLRGKPLDERGLASRLRQYGLKSKTIRLADGATPKGYSRADFADVWTRYLPSPAGAATTATSATNGNGKSLDRNPERDRADGVVADVADVADCGGKERRCAHCGSNAGDLVEASANGKALFIHEHCVSPFMTNASAQ